MYGVVFRRFERKNDIKTDFLSTAGLNLFQGRNIGGYGTHA